MKIQMNNDLNIENSHKIGELNANYEDLTRIFGLPAFFYRKTTKIEWRGEINNHLFTLYDWKEEGRLSDIKTWYIGGNTLETAALVTEYYNKMLNKKCFNCDKLMSLDSLPKYSWGELKYTPLCLECFEELDYGDNDYPSMQEDYDEEMRYNEKYKEE